jgi:hypothetical protein
MKKSPQGALSLAILFSLCFIVARAQTYTVVKAKGVVHCERLKKDLQAGDKIDAQDKLKFGSPDALLIVISPKDGRKAVKPGGKNSSSELRSLLTNIVSLEKKNTGVRGHEDKTKQDMAFDTLKAQFNVTKLVILGSGKINLAGYNLTLNDTAVVKARFKSGNSYAEKPISAGAVLDLSKGNIFGTLAPDKIQLIYWPNVKKDVFESPPKSLGNFVPVYIDNEDHLKKEVQVVETTFAEKSRDEVVKEVKKYIEDEYGAVLNENLIQWLKEANLVKP